MIEEEGVRRGRLERLRQNGLDPYPARVDRTHAVAEFLSQFERLQEDKSVVTVVGRMRTIRKHGGLTFAQVEDGSGVMQMAIRRDNVGEETYAGFHDTADMGDFVEARGTAFTTKTGQQTLDVQSYRLIAKSLLPMPEKWHGLSDTEIRYRQRYLDLLANESVRHNFRVRSTILRTIRTYLDRHAFLEVETPVLQAIPGGASARPFTTHHNALDADLYLRVAPELYLKRCLVGGFERVYEIARCFRNEGIDHAHNPEFTQVEGYAAYMDYEDLMVFLEAMLREVIRACGLDPAAVPYRGHSLDFASPWPRIKFRDAIRSHAGLDIEAFPDRESIARQAVKLGVPVSPTDSHTTIIDNLYKHHVRPKIVQPTYLIDYPVEISPLAKRKADDPRYVEMFQLVYGGGVENVKAFSELNDPLDQEERFRAQQEARDKGDEEAQFGDDDFVTALKHGMPPTAGFGIGIDRLAATLTDSHNLKEVILFPTLKPEMQRAAPTGAARPQDVRGAIVARLVERGVWFEAKHHGPRPEDSDAALGYDPARRPHHAGAKAIVVKGKKTGGFFQFVLPDDCQIDQKKASKVLGEPFSFASPDEVVRVTGCVPGSVPPFGSVLGLQSHVDVRLKENEMIFFNAGLLTDSIRMRLSDYLAVEPAVEVDVV